MSPETEIPQVKEPDLPVDQRRIDDEGEERKDIKEWSLELLLKHLRTILSTFVVIALFVAFIVSNSLTGFVCTIIATNIVEKKYRKHEGINTTNQFTGPLYVIGEGDYSMKSVDDKPVYLRMDIILELDSRKVIDEARENDSRMRSIIREIVTNKNIDEFSARTGMQHARRLMLEAINKILTRGKITNIYFTDYRFIWNNTITE